MRDRRDVTHNTNAEGLTSKRPWAIKPSRGTSPVYLDAVSIGHVDDMFKDLYTKIGNSREELPRTLANAFTVQQESGLYVPAAHAITHQSGGTDEIDVTDLVGLLADPQTPLAHKTSHENGGTDEISVLGLSGLLADPQTPLAHAVSHQAGGSDAIQLDNLAAPDDNTDLNASAAAHGLLPKLSNVATEYLNGTGAFSTPPDTGAPVDADYIVKTANGGLSAERVATDSTSITWDFSVAAQAALKRAALTGDVTSAINSNSVVVDKASEDFAFTGVESPGSYAADQNNLSIAATTTVLRITSSVDFSITGIAGGYAGRVLILCYIGGRLVHLPQESILSTDINRILHTPSVVGTANCTAKEYECLVLWYDGVVNRWRVIARNNLTDIRHGGTGLSAYNQGDILYASAADVLSSLAAGTVGQRLRTAGAAANPEWVYNGPMHEVLYRTTAETISAGTDPYASTLTKTNLGTSFVIMGGDVLVTMDRFTKIVVNARCGSSAGATISVEIYNITNAASLVTATTTAIGLTNITATADVALTGVKGLVARVKASNATDDPVFNNISLELY